MVVMVPVMMVLVIFILYGAGRSLLVALLVVGLVVMLMALLV